MILGHANWVKELDCWRVVPSRKELARAGSWDIWDIRRVLARRRRQCLLDSLVAHSMFCLIELDHQRVCALAGDWNGPGYA